MGKGIPGLDQAYHGFFVLMLIILAIMLMLCLIRAIIGPKVADRVVSVNMMGTMIMVIIAILTVMMGEGYLADICIIYAMISFLAVIVLTKVYMGVYQEKKEAEMKEAEAAAAAENAAGAVESSPAAAEEADARAVQTARHEADAATESAAVTGAEEAKSNGSI